MRKKLLVADYLEHPQELSVEGVCAKNDRDERQWRIEVEQQRSLLKGKVFDGLVISAPCRCLCQGIWRFVD